MLTGPFVKQPWRHPFRVLTFGGMCAIILSILIDILNTGQNSVSGKDVVILQEV